ncbi:aldehyde dehydrogenase (NADP(+)) [Larsenimonas rhizosphaerae]|uniref:aldehyde dehydrogenase (NADP(+)) n=1 Tax=Larsenimonas rhizosphaerae TaxID=2944682 RepID=UPI002033E495|nr:aldehyde dehydrogenase (NADP(+)) [Larsenimonas rhizosphaerae]MCM2129761.1 aldehyde dehydrogenase (NADP(+)) [Larsenimonas rhizosphaerae]
MQLTGELLIGQTAVKGSQKVVHAINPATGEALEPGYPGGTRDEVDRACELAWAAFDAYRETSLEDRARFLEAIADEIEAVGDELTERGTLETGLPEARLNGERGRTCNQLRLFARVVRDGEWLDVRVDPARPDREPMPRVDLRQRHIGLGPVAVFGASNFPLAFSVAGGDTASALAAGCPVVVKAHGAHPGTSELVGRAIQRAVASCNLPEGVFSLLYGAGRDIGHALVSDPRIKAAGFTGSRSGGLALWKAAQQRAEPIPFYAEMSSINPVFLMADKLESEAQALGEAFIGSLNMNAGQFCTNPGLVIAVKGDGLDTFKRAAVAALDGATAQTMLTPGIHDAYVEAVKALDASDKAERLGQGPASEGKNACQAGLFATSAQHFINDEALSREVFGSTSLIVECDSLDEARQVAEQVEGQLTITVHMNEADTQDVKALLPVLERKAGRILVNGWPTGVEVCDAMVHGGPFPATSDARTTSVGTAAIDRFLRPVCYQNLPDVLRPEALRDVNPLGLDRLVDGRRER